jgi:hypothetical protein
METRKVRLNVESYENIATGNFDDNIYTLKSGDEFLSFYYRDINDNKDILNGLNNKMVTIEFDNTKGHWKIPKLNYNGMELYRVNKSMIMAQPIMLFGHSKNQVRRAWLNSVLTHVFIGDLEDGNYMGTLVTPREIRKEITGKVLKEYVDKGCMYVMVNDYKKTVSPGFDLMIYKAMVDIQISSYPLAKVPRLMNTFTKHIDSSRACVDNVVREVNNIVLEKDVKLNFLVEKHMLGQFVGVDSERLKTLSVVLKDKHDSFLVDEWNGCENHDIVA